MNLSNIFNKSNLSMFINTARSQSLSTLYYRTKINIIENILYPRWFQQNSPTPSVLEKQREAQFQYNPLISIVVPTYNTPIPFLHEMIHSVQDQTYNNWELCIADASPADSEIRPILADYAATDSRIRIQYLENNEGISGNTNQALAISTGEFIGLLDHDDILAPTALFEIVDALNHDSTIDVLYTDEDKIDGDTKTHYYPNFKPDYNRGLLRSCNYITHFFVFKRNIYEEIGLFDSSYDGSQDYNYILRATRVAKHVHHIPKMLYHWRVHRGSVAGNPQQKSYCYAAATKALQDDLDYHQLNGAASMSALTGYYDIALTPPKKASVLIITMTSNCHLDCTLPEYSITHVVADNIQTLIETIQSATAEYIIIINKGITSYSTKALLDSLSYLQYTQFGAINYMLTKGSHTIGLGLAYTNDSIVDCYSSIPLADYGYYGRAAITQYLPLLSPAAFATRRETILSFIDEQSIDSIDEFALFYSLFLAKKQKHIVGLAKAHLPYSYSHSFASKDIFHNVNKEELVSLSKLYKIPPYYKK